MKSRELVAEAFSMSFWLKLGIRLDYHCSDSNGHLSCGCIDLRLE